MTKHRFSYLVMLSILLLLTACQQTPASTPAPPTQLYLAIRDEPSTLDLHRTSEPSAEEVLGYVCETLVYRGVDLTDKALLAESWEISSDGLILTFKLRQGITFHDGTPFNAEAVKFTFERLQQPESIESPIYEDFEGVRIETPDGYTVVFRFDEPRPDFFQVLRNTYAAIISPQAIQENEEMFGRQPICTGPYQVQEWVSSQHILLARNPDYNWPPEHYGNRGPAKIDELKIRFVSEHDTRYLALLKGELDLLSLSSSEEVEEILSLPDQFNTYESWVGGISYLGFNYQRAPINELLVRQALSHAVDKNTIVETILPGLAAPAVAPLAPSTFGFSDELANSGYPFNPERSRQLLAEAGFVDSDGDGILERDGEPLRLELLTTTSSTYGKIFTLIQKQLRDVGVEVEIRAVETSEIADITPTGEFDLLLYHYNWPYPSALQLFLSTERVGASNRVAYSNPEVDTLLEKAAQLPSNSPEKLALLVKAQEIILQDAPWHPLLVRKIFTAANTRVQGIKAHPRGGLLLHDAFIVENEH